MDFLNHGVQRIGHLGVHRHRVIALDEVGLPRAALEEVLDFLMGHAAEHGGVGDLVAVQVQDWQHSAVANGVQELVRLPGSRQGACLSLAIANGDRANQVGVIKDSTESMGDGIAQLAALVDGARRFGCHMGGNATGEGELLEQLAHAFLIAADIWIDLAIGAVQVGVGNEEVAAVAGAGNQNQILVVLFNNTVQVNIDEVLAGNGAPVTDDLALDVLALQRAAQQRVIQQIQLTGCQIVAGAPVGIHFLQFGLCHGFLHLLQQMLQKEAVFPCISLYVK